MDGHLCRCGTYPRIMKAIQLASTTHGGRDAMNAIITDTAVPFSRRDLLKGGGALIVGFSIGRRPRCRRLAARGDAAGPPDPNAIDSWIAIHADNTATVYLGKGEFGQGNTTGLLQIAGEELDLDMSQLRSVQLDTNVVPNQGATTSSSSIHRGGPQVRAAAAEARQALLALASTRLGVQTGSLTVSKGRGVDRRPPQPLGQLRRAARRQAVQREVHRHRAAEADQPLQARRHARAARRYSGQDRPANTPTCSTCACPTCCTAASCGRAASAPMAPAPSR